MPAAARGGFDTSMPRDPFIREKFTKERNAARRHAKEYFERFPEGPLPDGDRELARDAIAEYRVHHEATAGADQRG